MEHQLWKVIVEWLRLCGKPRRPRETFSDVEIVMVFFWAVLNDRPMSWACDQQNWPLAQRRWAKPSQSRLSRRLRAPSVRELLARVDREVLQSKHNLPTFWMIDGKPLVISGISKDKQAGYGRAAGGKAKGYKFHAIVGADNSLAAWRLAPMNVDEREMARRMLLVAKIQGYVVADGNYDSNKLHAVCDQRGNLQLVAPRRYGPQCGLGHRPQTPGRMRCKELLEGTQAELGQALLSQRVAIERYFGNLTNWGGGLTHLPPWARTYRRVHRWVQAKLIINAARRTVKSTTYVN